MNTKIMVWFLVLVMVVPGVLGQPPFQTEEPTIEEVPLHIMLPSNYHIKYNTPTVLWFGVFDVNGTKVLNDTTDCYFTMINTTGDLLVNTEMSYSSGANAWTHTYTPTHFGILSYRVYCNGSKGDGYISSGLVVSRDGQPWPVPSSPVGVLILVPLFFSLILLIGSASMGDDHPALKIGLYLFSTIPFLSSMHLATVSMVKFYHFPEIEGAIGTSTYWVSLIISLLVTYFVIYLFYKIILTAGQKRNERLNY